MSSNQINLSLHTRDFAALVQLLTEKESVIQHSLFQDDPIEIQLKRDLLSVLTEVETKELIRVMVKNVLSPVSGVPATGIGDKDRLSDALHLNSLLIRSLAVPFTNIARQFDPAAVISPDKCEACDTVDDCVELVTSKSKQD